MNVRDLLSGNDLRNCLLCFLVIWIRRNCETRNMSKICQKRKKKQKPEKPPKRGIPSSNSFGKNHTRWVFSWQEFHVSILLISKEDIYTALPKSAWQWNACLLGVCRVTASHGELSLMCYATLTTISLKHFFFVWRGALFNLAQYPLAAIPIFP